MHSNRSVNSTLIIDFLNIRYEKSEFVHINRIQKAQIYRNRHGTNKCYTKTLPQCNNILTQNGSACNITISARFKKRISPSQHKNVTVSFLA